MLDHLKSRQARKTRILGAVGAAGLALALAAPPAFAGSDTPSDDPSSAESSLVDHARHGLQSRLKYLVREGVISQEQADAIAEAIRGVREGFDKDTTFKERVEAYEAAWQQLIADGVVSQETADAIKAARTDFKLDRLVEQGVITQEQADALAAAVQEVRGGFDGDTSLEERKDAFNQMLDNLVAGGVITQEQADAIRDFRIRPHHGHHGNGDVDRTGGGHHGSAGQGHGGDGGGGGQGDDADRNHDSRGFGGRRR